MDTHRNVFVNKLYTVMLFQDESERKNLNFLFSLAVKHWV